ncbi:formylglycine-generating enzyme family protein [Stieleria sp. JC731]|uniref:formylglycine-generating enzyme family protein n=1 Tax=Stieleria sp. JC731 TaxID=2894195 RepID=UPI0039657D63
MDGGGLQGVNRVVRGGSWINSAQNCRSAYRNANDPGNRNNNLGFRLVAAHPSWIRRLTRLSLLSI